MFMFTIEAFLFFWFIIAYYSFLVLKHFHELYCQDTASILRSWKAPSSVLSSWLVIPCEVIKYHIIMWQKVTGNNFHDMMDRMSDRNWYKIWNVYLRILNNFPLRQIFSVKVENNEYLSLDKSDPLVSANSRLRTVIANVNHSFKAACPIVCFFLINQSIIIGHCFQDVMRSLGLVLKFGHLIWNLLHNSIQLEDCLWVIFHFSVFLHIWTLIMKYSSLVS